MGSIVTPTGKRRHRSISIRTADGAERTVCGLTVLPPVERRWQAPDCKRCHRVS